MKDFAVILAAGKGSRMNRKHNKVLEEVCSKPIILHIIDNLTNIGIKDIFVVVGYDSQGVKNIVGNRAQYVEQKEQLGTGDAFMQR